MGVPAVFWGEPEGIFLAFVTESLISFAVKIKND